MSEIPETVLRAKTLELIEAIERKNNYLWAKAIAREAAKKKKTRKAG